VLQIGCVAVSHCASFPESEACLRAMRCVRVRVAGRSWQAQQALCEGPDLAKLLTQSCPTLQTLWMPPTGFVNNCDGGRSHSYCDYRQQ